MTGACLALLERGDPDRHLAVMAAPPAARGTLAVIYAYNLEVARAPWVTTQPLIAEMRLQWWRDVMDAAVAATAPPRAHEVAAPLAALIAEGQVSVAALDSIAAARRADLDPTFPETAADLWGYLAGTGGALAWAAASALGSPASDEGAVRGYGRAVALASYFAAVPGLVARGRVGLPPDADVAAMACEGLALIADARRAGLSPVTRPALLAGWQGAALLRLAARQPDRVAAGQLALSEFARRGRLLWQAATGRF